VAHGFQTSVMALATLWTNGVCTKKGESFEKRGRKVRKKWRLGSKKAKLFVFLRPIGLLKFVLASTKLWAL